MVHYFPLNLTEIAFVCPIEPQWVLQHAVCCHSVTIITQAVGKDVNMTTHQNILSGGTDLPINLAGSPDGEDWPSGIDRDREPSNRSAQLAVALAESQTRCAQLAQVQNERDCLLESQRQIMELIGSRSAEKIVHDLRNILNERALLRSLIPGL